MSLPVLRQDLKIFEAANTRSGAPSWTLYDPSREAYFQIGVLELEMLSRWHLDDATLIVRKIAEQTTLHPGEEDVLRLCEFLKANHLVHGWWIDAARAKARYVPFRRILDQLVFTRVTLFRCRGFLERSIRRIEWMFTPLFMKVVAAGGFLSLYLVSRQWDAYSNQFSYLFTLEGAIIGLLVLAFSKMCHELGHAYVATRHGVPVPEIGVALVVFWPMLYTNTTHAWRIKDRRARLMIDAAGIFAELILAIVFTLVWCVLPEGTLRGAVWYLSSSAWIVTLAVNLNPLMRFDGYYLLADRLDMPNLMSRSLAMARWWLRCSAFGFSELPPENQGKSTRNAMVIYGIACGAYRVTIVCAIIVAIYHMFFKALALLLAGAVVWYYIVLPLRRESAQWLPMLRIYLQGGMKRRRFWAVAILVLAVILPLPTVVRVPAVAVATEESRIHSVVPAWVSEVTVYEGRRVEKGQILVILESPDLENRRKQAEVRARALAVQLARQPAALSLRENHQVLTQRYAEVLSEISGIDEQIAQLVVRAQHDGVIRDISEQLRVGSWVGPREQLMRVVGAGVTVDGYVTESGMSRFGSGASGRFFPELPGASSFAVSGAEADPVRALRIERAALASTDGGALEAQRDERGNLVPVGAAYRIRSQSVDAMSVSGMTMRGEVLFEGAWRSLLVSWLRPLFSVLVRESAF